MKQVGRRLLGGLFAVVLVASGIANAQISVRGNLAHDLDVFPGQRVTGTVVVDNDSDQPQQAKVYLSDYMFFADGTNEYGDPGTGPHSSANWVRFSPESMTIPPRSSATISYEMLIPETAEPGSYWCMMMVEGVDTSSSESTSETESDRQVGFRQVTRYGVQLAAHIRDQAEQKVEFDGVELLVNEEGATFFQADVTNVGSLMLHPTVYLRVFAADGEEFGPFDGTQYRMYPGTSVRQRIELSSLKAGTYQALLIVDNGEDAVFGGQYELTL